MKKIATLLLVFSIALGISKSTAQVTPSICMVTVDDESVNNIIYWDNTAYTNIDSFIVYREVSAGTYARIGAVPSDSLSQFVDTSRSIGPANGDPNLASYRYKLQMRDSAGVYSPLSPYHSTIYITDNGAGQFNWSTPYTIEGAPNHINHYVLLCDTANTNFWIPVNSVDSSQGSAIDPGFANHSAIANWRVKTLWTISCTPTRSSITTTRSNIKRSMLVSGVNSLEANTNTIAIYPNPASEMVTIEASNSSINTTHSGLVKIYNLLGELVYQSAITKQKSEVNITSFTKGIYTLEFDSTTGRSFRKLVVQ